MLLNRVTQAPTQSPYGSSGNGMKETKASGHSRGATLPLVLSDGPDFFEKVPRTPHGPVDRAGH